VPDGEGFDLDECTQQQAPLAPRAEPDTTPVDTLAALIAAVHQQRKNARVGVDHGVVQACAHYAQSPATRTASLKLLAECVDVERHALLVLLRDPECVSRVLPLPADDAVSCEVSAGLVRDVAIDPFGRKQLVRHHSHVVDLVARSAHPHASYKAAREAVAGALANLALAEELRALYAKVPARCPLREERRFTVATFNRRVPARLSCD
jgi:hypothetical protein